MNEAIGQRPSVRPLSLYSSGPSCAVLDLSKSTDGEATASASAGGPHSSEGSTAESSPEMPLQMPGRKRRSDGSAAEAVKEWCTNLEKRHEEDDARDAAWLNHSQQQMDKMLDLVGRFVDHLTK
ncbi:unnamed protein product [Knipowitschia caucasica]|uniref:Uncharacterized protein n=1 Tax=Knipowitschia caucasica TaxID=637954 RepID=A0AAV2L1V5_KNICA